MGWFNHQLDDDDAVAVAGDDDDLSIFTHPTWSSIKLKGYCYVMTPQNAEDVPKKRMDVIFGPVGYELLYICNVYECLQKIAKLLGQCTFFSPIHMFLVFLRGFKHTFHVHSGNLT